MSQQCLICHENITSELLISCTNARGPHSICRDDFKRYCEYFAETGPNLDPRSLQIRKGRLYCPLHPLSQQNPFAEPPPYMNCESEPFNAAQIESATNRETAAACMAVEDQFKQLQRTLLEQPEARAEPSLMETLQNLRLDLRQCAHCGHGPVEHTGCHDLLSNHSRWPSAREGVSNACPECNWFSPDADAWPRWTGPDRPPTSPAARRTVADVAAQRGYRTRLCARFERGVACPQGAACYFAHGRRQLLPEEWEERRLPERREPRAPRRPARGWRIR